MCVASSYPINTLTESLMYTEQGHHRREMISFLILLPRCATEEGCDELVLASSPDYEQNRHVFSGPHGRWIDVEIPGAVNVKNTVKGYL